MGLIWVAREKISGSGKKRKWVGHSGRGGGEGGKAGRARGVAILQRIMECHVQMIDRGNDKGILLWI